MQLLAKLFKQTTGRISNAEGRLRPRGGEPPGRRRMAAGERPVQAGLRQGRGLRPSGTGGDALDRGRLVALGKAPDAILGRI
jgi:hypothetical protein